MKVLDMEDAEEIKRNLSGNGGGNGKAKKIGGKNGEHRASSPMVDLNSFQIKVLSPEQEDRVRKEAAERKAYAKKAGEVIVNVRIRLRQLELARNIGILLPDEEKEFAEIRKAEDAILEACDEALQKNILLYAFLEEVKSSKRDRGIVSGLLAQAVKKGLYRLATVVETTNGWMENQWPEGTVFGFGYGVNQCIYFLNPVTQKDFSDELAEAFRKAVKETVAAEEEHEKKEMARLRAAGGLEISKLKDGAIGNYIVVFPGGSRVSEGVGILSVCENAVNEKPIWTIMAVDGAGSLSWLRENKGRFFPFIWMLDGISEKAPDESRHFAKTLLKAIRDSEKFSRNVHAK